MSSLTEKVKEVMECREEASAKKEQTADGKRSYKIPTDLSVSSYIYTLKTAAPTVMVLMAKKCKCLFYLCTLCLCIILYLIVKSTISSEAVSIEKNGSFWG